VCYPEDLYLSVCLTNLVLLSNLQKLKDVHFQSEIGYKIHSLV